MSHRLWCCTFLVCSTVSVVTTSILLYYGLFLPTFHPNRQLGAMPPFYSSAFLPIFAATDGQTKSMPLQVSIAPSHLSSHLISNANLTVHCNKLKGTCKSGKQGDGNSSSFGVELKTLSKNWQVKNNNTGSKNGQNTGLRYRQSIFRNSMANHHQNGTLSAVANSTLEAVNHLNRTQAALKLATLKEYLFMVLLTDAIFSAWAVLCLFVLLLRRWYQQMDEIDELDEEEDSEDEDEGFGSREDLEAGDDRGNGRRQRIPVQLIVDGGHDQVALQIEEEESVDETDNEEFDEEEEEEFEEDVEFEEGEDFEDEEEEDFEDSSWDEGFYDEEFESENIDEEGDDGELDEQGENEDGVVPPLPLPPFANQFLEAEPNRVLPFALPFGRRLDWIRSNNQPRPIMV